MFDTSIRYGIIGCVGIGTTHGKAVQDAEGVDLVAAADTIEANAREFADNYDCEWYTDHVEMIEDANLDAVSICTPSGTHSDIAVSAAKAGANILCEKPLDVYLDRIDSMIETAEEVGVTLAGVYQRRTYSEHQRAKKAVENGKLGQMVLGDAMVKWHRTQGYYDSGNWRGTRKMDGGCLMNQAIHLIDLLQWLMGDVESVYAMMDTTVHEMDMEDVATVALQFENGAYGAIEATTSVRGGKDSLELNGTAGSYNSGEFDLHEGEIDFEPEEREWGVGHTRIVQDFVDSLREGSEPMIPAREARKAIEIILAAYASANLNREVRINELYEIHRETRIDELDATVNHSEFKQ